MQGGASEMPITTFSRRGLIFGTATALVQVRAAVAKARTEPRHYATLQSIRGRGNLCM